MMVQVVFATVQVDWSVRVQAPVVETQHVP